MRSCGSRRDGHGLRPHDHCCLAYADTETFLAHGVNFLREGLARGERAMYVQAASEADLRWDLAALGDVDTLAAEGRLELVTLHDVYGSGGLDVDGQLAFYDAAIDAALHDGYRGLRVFADGTSLVTADPVGMARWEARADRILAERPMTAMCCYDRRVVPAASLALLNAVHPLGCGGQAQEFHVFSLADGLALGGSLDSFAVDAFEEAFEVARPTSGFTLDLSALRFIDHAGVLAIARRVADGSQVTVVGAPYAYTRVAGLLGV